MTESTLYEELKKTGAPIDNWQSDLYVLKTPETERILRGIDAKQVFRAIDGRLWYEVPFAFEPFWDKKLRK